MIRIATDFDAAEMLAIYAPYVEKTAVTFDTVVPTVEEFKNKVKKILAEAPFLVYEVNGEVMGYAYAKQYCIKEAYQWTRELSVYIREDVRAKKYATSLYISLVELLKCQNYRNALVGITLPNIPAVNFHERFGFHPVGVYHNVGYKLGKIHKVGWWQLPVSDPEESVKTIISLEKVLATEKGQKALKRGEARIIGM